MQSSVIKRSVAIALAGLILSAASIEVMASVSIRGARSCGQWIEARKGGLNNAESWLVGYLSGMAVASGSDILDGTDNPSIFLWVDNYCQANPLEGIADAGFKIFIELKKKKQL